MITTFLSDKVVAHWWVILNRKRIGTGVYTGANICLSRNIHCLFQISNSDFPQHINWSCHLKKIAVVGHIVASFPMAECQSADSRTALFEIHESRSDPSVHRVNFCFQSLFVLFFTAGHISPA